MKIFVDSADIADIERAMSLGICDGVTTNPSLIAKAGKGFESHIASIAALVPGPVHAEPLTLDYEQLIKEGRALAKIAPNIVVKIPMTHVGLRAVHTLSQEGIDTNVTLIFSACQAILAAKAGASYVSPFVGRLDDISHDGAGLVDCIATIYDQYETMTTEIIVASVRHPLHVIEGACVGADIFTIPGKVLTQMEKHPLTDIGIKKFLADGAKYS